MTDLPQVAQIILDTVFMIALVILLTRIVGLRSFAKFTSFDFALTVATGSIIASVVVSPDRSLVVGTVALCAIFALQWGIARLRVLFRPVHDMTRNTPLLLVRNGQIDDQALAVSNVTRTDILSKIRGSGAPSMAQVAAVVLETTGDVSVLVRRSGDPAFDTSLIDDVRRVGLPMDPKPEQAA